MMRVAMIAAVWGILTQPVFAAQLGVHAEPARNQYLLYEPVIVNVTITNNSEHQVVLRSEDGHPWLSFLLSKSDDSSIKPDQAGSFESLLLNAGESRTLAVNITPLYAFRETGQYKVRAVASLNGEDVLTSIGQFTISAGQKIWSETRPWQGSQLIYSLIRFSPDIQTSNLYIRVEDEQENVVYATYSLGRLISYMDPQALFDTNGKLHILHVQGLDSYRYTRLDPYGKLDTQINYSVGPDNTAPLLSKTTDGLVLVGGGRSEADMVAKDKLSDSQALLGAAPVVPSVTAKP